ncbi:MAG: CARDB domain-containing protein [Candidatus Kariarchaeaceae archaeon]|jgi:hypothetical protein
MNLKVSLLILLVLMTPIFIDGASSGDDDPPPPPSSSSGGGGGSPEFYDYYIPLIFNDSHRHGYSEVSIWIVQPTILITSFGLSEAGNNLAQISTPIKLTFNPNENPGLTNGSLIRATTPLLVVGHRTSEDIYSDNSFAYSILIDRMMGFQFISPVNGWISVFTLTQNAQILIPDGKGNSIPINILAGGSNEAIPVRKGDFINSTVPVNAAFISYENGTYASMAVPKYLQGSDYIFDSDLTQARENEIKLSSLNIIPEKPTEIQLLYENAEIERIAIFGPTNLYLSRNLRAIHSTRGEISVSIFQKHAYGGLLRTSLVQLIAASEMRAGELFVSPEGFSTHISTLNEDTNFVTGIFDINSNNYVAASKTNISRTLYEVVRYVGLSDAHIILGDEASFSIITSPGLASHPMAPSVAFLNLPLNPSSTKPNATGLTSTWFRFPNLAVSSIDIIPGPPEEYTGQEIRIRIISNGTLPASRFNVIITIDQENVLEEEFDFLQVNSTLEFTFTKFLSYGKTAINITARVDITDNVNEINEDDNSSSLDVQVIRNIRLRLTISGLIILIVLYFLNRIRKSIKLRKELNRSHVDTIINFENLEDEV